MRAKALSAKFRCWWLAIPAMTATIQFSLKNLSLALEEQPFGQVWLKQTASNPWLYIVVIFEIISFMLWMRILATVNVSRAVPLTAISYIAVLLTSWILFHEPVMLLQVVGSLFILVGIACISTAPTS